VSGPLLRAEVIIIHENGKQVLVQCDNEESFYRFPGGSIEFGETAAEAIQRELIEEYDLPSEIGILACVNENIIEYDGKKRHNCTLLHWGSIELNILDDYIQHKEQFHVKLTWRNFDQLKKKPVYPEGILDFILQRSETPIHLVIRKNTIYE
jgi:8-oxo-dGTP diphosphatase